jgi:oligopeptide/dipeptide ABC transporter ATP-binding protein
MEFSLYCFVAFGPFLLAYARSVKKTNFHQLISAVPVVDPANKRKRILLSGDPTSPIHPPTGCPFHPRCPVAEPRCKTEVPPLRPITSSHFTACHCAT